MTAKQLNFQALPALAIAEGATTPNPGAPGAQAWSTSLAKVVVWTGALWTAPAGGGGSGLSAAQVRAQNLLGF